MRTITVTEVARVLDEIVAEHPENYTYDDRIVELLGHPPVGGRCENYVILEDGRKVGACIVGTVIDRLGYLDRLDPHYQSSTYYGVTERIQQEGDVEFEEDALLLLGRAQSAQDERVTWPNAVRLAKIEVGLMEPEVVR